MERFIPYQRLSKKQKRIINSRKRASWRISPVTRKTKNPKAYDRKKTRSDWLNSDKELIHLSTVS